MDAGDFSALDASYKQALYALTAGLGLKLVLITLMTVRCRIVSGEMRPIPEDNNAVIGFLIDYIFKPLLLVCPIGPDQRNAQAVASGSTPFVPLGGSDPRLAAWLGAHRNATEHEPWFMGMAVAYWFLGAARVSWAPALLYVFLAGRVLHMFCYVCGLQPWRALAFMTALSTQFGFGAVMLVGLSSLDTAVQGWAPQLCILTAGLGLKVVVITLMTVRCRIVSGQFRPIPEDNNVVLECLINYVFKALLLICPVGPGEDKPNEEQPSGVDTDPRLVAWLSAHRNATEQEPWFMAMAIAHLCIGGWNSGMEPVLIYVFLASRVLHMLAYVCGLQPWRTLTFVTALFTQLGFGVVMFIKLHFTVDGAGFPLCILTAGLGLKIVVVTLMTLRCRMVSGQFRPIPEDNNAVVGCLINYVFKALLLVCPLGPGEDKPNDGQSEGVDTDPHLAAWLGAHRNATEQEPWFMFMVTAWAIGSNTYPAFKNCVPVLMYVYFGGRVLHMLSYACGLQPWRSLTFVTSLFTHLGLGVLMLISMKQ